MAEVLLSQADIDLVDAGIQALQVAQGVATDEVRESHQRIFDHGLDVRIPGRDDSVVVRLDEVAKWKEWAEAAVAVAGAAFSVYRAAKSGREFEDDALRNHLEFTPNASIEELIEARDQMARALSEAGG